MAQEFLEVGNNDRGEVVINLPRDMTGHIVFSPEQACGLAGNLWRHAEELLAERNDKIQGRSKCPCGSGRMYKNCCANNAERAAAAPVAAADVAVEAMTPEQEKAYYEGLARCIEILLPPGPSSTGRMMFLTIMFDRTDSVSYVSNVERHGAMLALSQLLSQWHAEEKDHARIIVAPANDKQPGILRG